MIFSGSNKKSVISPFSFSFIILVFILFPEIIFFVYEFVMLSHEYIVSLQEKNNSSFSLEYWIFDISFLFPERIMSLKVIEQMVLEHDDQKLIICLSYLHMPLSHIYQYINNLLIENKNYIP